MSSALGCDLRVRGLLGMIELQGDYKGYEW